jgi:hypothetical protein
MSRRSAVTCWGTNGIVVGAGLVGFISAQPVSRTTTIQSQRMVLSLHLSSVRVGLTTANVVVVDRGTPPKSVY